MGGANTAKAPTNNGASGAAGQEDDLSALQQQRQQRREEEKRQLGQLLGGGKANGGGGLLGGLLGGGGGAGKQTNAAPESMVADTAGQGSSQGLPTADENGEVTMVFRQVRILTPNPSQARFCSTNNTTQLNSNHVNDTNIDQPRRCRSPQRLHRRHVWRHKSRVLPKRRSHPERPRPWIRRPLNRHENRFPSQGQDARGHDLRRQSRQC